MNSRLEKIRNRKRLKKGLPMIETEEKTAALSSSEEDQEVIIIHYNNKHLAQPHFFTFCLPVRVRIAYEGTR